MAKQIRKQTLSLSSFLESVNEEDIREDQDVQRLSGAWDAGMINEIIVTVLTDDYIPPIILGEEELTEGAQLWLIDGLQRTSSLIRYRYGHYRITSTIENSIIEYQKKKLDKNGKVCRDDDGNIIWETTGFDIKGKTYDDLPKELKKKFNDYQIETVIHQDCTMEMISKLIRRYNNHKSMNSAQKAFTYVDKYARKIRNITEHRFFKDCGTYTEKEKINGVRERIVCESIMTMFHLNNWKKQGNKMGAYINHNSAIEEFEILENVLNRMEIILADNYKNIFTSKDSFIWFTLFYRFTKLGLEDSKFATFLQAFIQKLHSTHIEGFDNKSFDDIDANKATKDKKVINEKLAFLETLMLEFLHIEREEEIVLNPEFLDSKILEYTKIFANTDIFKVISLHKEEILTVAIQSLALLDGQELKTTKDAQDFVNRGISEELIENALLYISSLSDWSVEVDNNSPAFIKENIPMLVKLVAYVYEKEDIDENAAIKWFEKFVANYKYETRINEEKFNEMLNDLSKYIVNKEFTKAS